jgi:hypothetical protein
VSNQLHRVLWAWERLGAAGVPRTVQQYSVLMHACNRQSQWAATLAHWAAMRATTAPPLAPCVRAYTCVIRAWGERGDHHEVRHQAHMRSKTRVPALCSAS